MVESKNELRSLPEGFRWKLVAAGTVDEVQEKADKLEDNDNPEECEIVINGNTAILYKVAPAK